MTFTKAVQLAYNEWRFFTFLMFFYNNLQLLTGLFLQCNVKNSFYNKEPNPEWYFTDRPQI